MASDAPYIAHDDALYVITMLLEIQSKDIERISPSLTPSHYASTLSTPLYLFVQLSMALYNPKVSERFSRQSLLTHHPYSLLVAPSSPLLGNSNNGTSVKLTFRL
jgi:hypothetical protein